MSSQTQSDVVVKSKTQIEFALPRDHKVIFLNDEVTPMDFVVAVLIEIFEHNGETAETLATKIHTEGSAVIAVLPYELAEHKGIEATVSARSNGYPLQVKIEPE